MEGKEEGRMLERFIAEHRTGHVGCNNLVLALQLERLAILPYLLSARVVFRRIDLFTRTARSYLRLGTNPPYTWRNR